MRNLFSIVFLSLVILVNQGVPNVIFPLPNQSSIEIDRNDNQYSSEFQLTELDFRYAPGVDNFSVQDFVNYKNANINKCIWINDGIPVNFANVIINISKMTGINPRIHLVLVDINLDIFSSQEAVIDCEKISSFLDMMRSVSYHMMEAWSFYQFGDFDPTKTVASFSEDRSEINNGIEFAIMEGLRNLPNNSQKDVFDFNSRYFDYFENNSKVITENIDEIKADSVVVFKLPFTGKHTFSGGPHGGGTTNDCDGIDSSVASGLDFAGSFPDNGMLNDAVIAIAPGTIVGIKTSDTAPGKWVAIQHDNGIVSMYWHMSTISSGLQLYDHVEYGAYLGDRGNTGCSGCGVHIHLELRTGGTNYSVYSGIGAPVTWHGRIIDGYLIDSIIKTDGKAANYEGTAIWMENVWATSIKQFTMCGGNVNAIVEANFPNINPVNSQNTFFANKSSSSILVSSNDALFYCPSPTFSLASFPLFGNRVLPFGICDIPSDATPPSGSFTSPPNGSSITSRTVNVSVSASDNSGGSGVREVRFSAKWSGIWHDIGVDSSSPYNVNWDICNYDVPNGDIELGMEIWDNADNQWIYSNHYPNPHITKNIDCSVSGLPSVNQWHAEAWMNKYLAGYVNHDEYWPAGVTGVQYPFIGFEKDWGTGAPYSGFPSDQFSFKIYSNLYFNGGQYFFRVCSDDGVVLEIDGEKKIDEWWDRGGCLQTDKWLDNKYHTIEVRYYENGGNAYIKLYIWGAEYPKPELEEPDGKITLPSNNSYISQNPLQIWADAWDDTSGVSYVKFKVYHCVGGCQWRDLGTDYTPPFMVNNWDWSSLNGQQIKLAIDVYDKSGRSRGNAGGEVIVNLDNVIPSISFISPSSGSVDEDKIVNLSVSASDANSGVANIKFYAGYDDGVNYWHEIGTDVDGSNGWGLNWNGLLLPDGSLVNFYATISDRAGNSSSTIVTNVRLGNPPVFPIFLPIIRKD